MNQLIGGSSLSIDPAADDISLLGDEAPLTCADLYPPGDESLGDSTLKGRASASKVKQAT